MQQRVGEAHLADRATGAIRTAVPPVAAEFLADQHMLAVAAVADDGLVWASVLTGSPGFLQLSPTAGFVFVDWDTGATLQVSGRATVRFDVPEEAQMPGARRVVDVEVARVVELPASVPSYGARRRRRASTRTSPDAGPAALTPPTR